MQIVEIDGYLTQDKLEKVCKKIADKWRAKEQKIIDGMKLKILSGGKS